MQVNVRFLDNLRLEASFDDYSIITDQPVRYKGDGTAPSPFDYFLASSALCAAYFVKLYCKTRDIPTEDIKVTQQNIVDPDNRYHQDFNIQIELPSDISEKDRLGILASMERCTVKRVIQNTPLFSITSNSSDKSADIDYENYDESDFKTQIIGKDCTLEETITNMRGLLTNLGIKIEIASWRNPLPHVWSVHIRDADSPMCYTNGKGATKDAALCSALGEYLERLSCNYFYSDFYLGEEISKGDFVHYPNEKWFSLVANSSQSHDFPEGLMDDLLKETYSLDGELKAEHLIDTNSGYRERGVCALPFQRHTDNETVYIPVNLIGNLFVSNGMSAGNTIYEARAQALSEIFERAIKNKIILEEITLPDVPELILKSFPKIWEGIVALREKGYPIVVKDASLGGIYPVMCVTLMNPNNGGVFASFGAHPNFEVALERSLTELMQGRSFEGLSDTAPPTFNNFAVTEHNNIVDHFIDSTGVISWKFFSDKPVYEFHHWNFFGSTEEEYLGLVAILDKLGKVAYVADYEDLGAKACRILVPNFSEIYEKDDLVWDNNNIALGFRSEILSLHSLTDDELITVVANIEDAELDDFMPVSELIGVAFDEADAWGRLTVGELKGLIFLKNKRFEEAKQMFELFFTFNDSTPERRRFYQLLSAIIDIQVLSEEEESSEDITISNYMSAFEKMYSKELVTSVINCFEGRDPFPGLTPTNLNFKGLDKHLRLIESYKKLINARRKLNS